MGFYDKKNQGSIFWSTFKWLKSKRVDDLSSNAVDDMSFSIYLFLKESSVCFFLKKKTKEGCHASSPLNQEIY